MKLADLLDRLSLYLPVMLMGVMALGTYWLVHSTPESEVKPAQKVTSQEPDYFMRDFAVKTFYPSGALKSEVRGALAHHYPDSDALEIEQVQMRSFDEQGQLTTARANRARVNADGSQVHLIGQAEVVRAATTGQQARAEVRMSGEQLLAFPQARRVTSEQAVVLQRGSDRIRANRLDFDDAAGVAQLQGQVRGVLMPASGNKAKGR